MNSACRQCRTELPEGAHGRLDLEALAPALSSGHAAECAECAAWIAQVTRLAGGLYSLPSLSAPAELAGRVVASMQAGDREHRAVRAVEQLSRVSSPETLAHTVEDEVERAGDLSPAALSAAPQIGAPSVLERLVREELAEPQKFMVRRVLGGLSRQPVPGALDERVAAQLSRDRTARRTLLGPGSRRLAWASLAAAALLVLGLQVGPRGLLGVPADGLPVGTKARPFDVVYAQSVHDLDPVARVLVDGVSGGLLTARGL